MWDEHHVEVRRAMFKRIEHPLAGPVELVCEVLHISDTDQRLEVYTAEPGSRTEAAFGELAGLDHAAARGT